MMVAHLCRITGLGMFIKRIQIYAGLENKIQF
jgi:hypothetical protein